jgi:hypothetical protein
MGEVLRLLKSPKTAERSKPGGRMTSESSPAASVALSAFRTLPRARLRSPPSTARAVG